ncbi:MAG: hypothetical protein FWD77_09530 [Betaproteobacteria bacterium]|nr:hypothetical protein [Betaproteobacteria bacterium]
MSLPPNANAPLDFVRHLWSNMGFSLPGMVTPTFDADELQKRIEDLKAVEGWLRMNLSVLQLTIQNLEMQHSTIGAVRAMGKFASASVQETAQASQSLAMPPLSEPKREIPAEPPEEKANSGTPEISPAFAQAALWPWNMMQQMQQMHAQMQEAQHRDSQQEKAPAAAQPPKKRASAPASAKTPSGRKKPSQA